MFAGIAPRYDFLNHLLSFQTDRLWRRKAVRSAAIKPSSRVLDICAGTGELSFAFAKAGAQVTGTDFCPEMIQLAQDKRERHSYSASTQFAVADSLSLPFRDSQFDVVSVAFGVRNLSDWKQGLTEMHRVLQSGGRAVILEFTEPKGRGFQSLYRFYFRKVLPRVGRWVSGDNEAYSYLPESVSKFATPDQLAEQMKQIGFSNISIRPLSGGIAALIVGEK